MNTSQYSKLQYRFHFHHPLIISSFSQQPQQPGPIPDTPESPTTTLFQMTL